MKNAIRRALRDLLVPVVVLVALVAGVLVFGGRDIPPPDVSDLLPQRESIPDADNAYTHFCEPSAPSQTASGQCVRMRLSLVSRGAW